MFQLELVFRLLVYMYPQFMYLQFNVYSHQCVLTFSESGRSRQSIILITTFITALSLSLASWATACRRNTVQASPWHTACEVLSLYCHCFRYSTLPPRAPDIKAHRVCFRALSGTESSLAISSSSTNPSSPLLSLS